MIKLRNRLLVTLVLAAAFVAVMGTGIAEAARRAPTGPGVSPRGSVHRPTGTFGCGEPDTGNNGLPKVTVPTVFNSTTGSGWALQQWIHWTWINANKNPRTR